MDISQMHITEQVSVEGNGSIEINDISSGQLSSLTIGGGCSWMPPGYEQLGAVGNIANSSKVNLGLYPHDGDVIEIKFRPNSGSFYLLQARQGTSGTIYGIGGAQSGSTLSGYFCGTTLTSEITRITGHDYITRLSAINGTLTFYVEDLTAGTSDTKTGTYTRSTYNTSYYLWGNASNTYAYRCGIYYAKITNGTSTRMYYVPANYNGNKGFYDFVSKSFKTNTHGQALTTYSTPADTSIIVPTPILPINITCNNGVIKYRNKSGLPSGYLKLDYIQGGNGSYIDTGIIPSCDVLHVKWKGQLLGSEYGGSFMGCSAGTTPRYGFRIFSNANNGQITLQSKNSLVGADGGFDISTVDVTYNNTNGNITGTINSDSVTQTGADINVTLNKNMLLFSAYVGNNVGSAGENKCWYLQIEKDGVIVADLIPAKRASDSVLGMYDLVSDTFLENQGTGSFTGGNIDYTDAEYYCDGTPETITDELGNTVNVENLLQVKNNTFEGTDTQDILSGIIHRNVGVKILRSSDVTEYQSTNRRFVLSAGSKQNLGTRVTPLFCTHFRTIDNGTALTNVPDMSIYGAGTTPNLYIHYTSYTTKSSFGNWLESQYTNGTPVIAVYPLDVPTTETVSPQSLSLIDGDNTITRSSNNILKLPISGEYIGVLQREEYSVLRGPCPEGFHVPLVNEWEGILSIVHNLGISEGYDTKQALKLPNTGCRGYDGALTNQGGLSIYVCSDGTNGGACTRLSMDAASEDFMYTSSKDGISIRAFKDEYVYPDNTWTVIHGTLGSAGIFWDQTNGIISVTDGTNGYTIMDKDMGANNVMSYGLLYQRGNNYGFPSSGSLSRTSTIKPNASTYGPGNYYESNIYITGSNGNSRSDPVNPNLWGYESFLSQDNDIYICGGPNNYVAMQGPCENGWHIPSINEIQELQSLNSLGINLSTALHMPLAGYYGYSHGIVDEGQKGYYQTSYAEYGLSGWFNCSASIIDSSISYTSPGGRQSTNAASIRPFKNEPVAPDNTWTTIYDGSSIASGAGIFRDQTNGYISISMDGINRKTISDKNIGATQVWNYGDSLTDNNTGKFFQRGNCYGFNRGRPSKYDDEYVDTEGYGPGNFYYSDTFKMNMRDWMKTSDGGGTDLWGYYSFYKNLEITVGDGYDYQLLRGPCPEGYHIPSSSERGGIREIMDIFDYNSVIGRKTYLHVPITGYIRYGDGNKAGEGDYGELWGATPNTDNRATMISLSAINGDQSMPTISGAYRTTGLNIRPFKDIPEMPDDSWTVVETQGNAGIYANQTLGLITLTDGIRLYTMCDKNLGATVVYNNGDAMSENNCGGFFQRGNNYMFPFAGPTTKSTTRVDTTGYGPGNYYSSDTFIYNKTDWSNPTNDNLRGAVNSQIQNVAEVYVGETLVWTNYQPITPTAGVYWCPTKKCISISANGTDWITMSDRNIGAAKPGDTGLLYQRGNNYGFPPQRLTTVSTDSTQIDVSSYGPNNYYYSDTYITSNIWRSNGDVRDLRGGVTFTDESVRGPCGEGWHIPSRGDWQYSINWAKQLISDYDAIRDMFKLGSGRYRDGAGDSKCCYYAVRCCEATYYSSSQKTYPYIMRAPGEHTSPVIDITQSMANYAHPIRPFRNNPVIPDDTSRIKLA